MRGPVADGQTVISTRPPALNLMGVVPAETGSQWEGEQLGQFILQKFVGGGGMGIVYRALDTTLDREVAVKVLSRDQSADDETLRRFRNEAQSAARLSHDNIARVFYVGEDRGVHYIVFEFIEGVNIRDLVDQQGPLPLNQALSYTYQIALALDHASQRSVIHRDIKPSNVLVTPAGKAKLVDMGLARLNLMAQASNDLTASGVTLGTFDYISPEQARDPRSADVRSDLYSLGCSLYYMLTGRPPFPDGTVLQKLLQHQADAHPDPRTERPDLPPQISRVLARLLAKNPAERYQQPAELIDELAELGQTLGMPLSESQPPRLAPRRTVEPSRWAQHLPWAAPIAALFLIVIGLDFYWSRSASEQTPLWSAAKTQLTKPRTLPLEPPEIDVPEAAAPQSTPAPALPIPSAAPPTSAAPAPSEMAPPTVLDPSTGFEPMPNEGESPGAAVAEASVPGATSKPATQLGPGLSDLFGSFGQEFYAEWRKREKTGRSSTPDAPADPLASPAGAPSARSPAAGDSAGAATPVATSDELDLSGNLADPPPPMPVATASATANVLTVGDDSQPNNYNSLLAACSAAKSGDTIELRYNGRRVEKPLVISNTRLTIVAGSGFRPIVVFAPDPGKWFGSTQMVSVAGGQLIVRDVHWEFNLPPNSPNDRSLFETQHCELLDFQNCTFTIRAQPPYYAGVAFFDVKAPPGTGTMDMGGTAADNHVVNIALKNCLARGEATLLRDTDLQPVRLTWNDGLLATSQRLFAAEGSSVQPKQEVHAELNLRHVTAMVNGLILMTNSQEEPHQLVVDLRCHDCILATTGSTPLVEQRGSAGIDEFLARFYWSGDSDYFQGFNIFQQVMNPSGQAGSKQLNFDQWRERWQYSSTHQFGGQDAAVWATRPSGGRPYHAHLASDYVLDTGAASNPALGGASDGSDAGARLPYLPVPPESTTSPGSEASAPTGAASVPAGAALGPGGTPSSGGSAAPMPR
jgi:serine/threonine-protein kinase